MCVIDFTSLLEARADLGRKGFQPIGGAVEGSGNTIWTNPIGDRAEIKLDDHGKFYVCHGPVLAHIRKH